MQYVRSISGSVSKTWNSINPATLSGAIDVIVVEQENGDLACSPFHVRFGKFSLLRPYEKKVEFRVNGVKTDYSMKLGEGGEAFFVFETAGIVPADMQTSPLVSPAGSPRQEPAISDPSVLQEPEYLNLGEGEGGDSSNAHKDPGTRMLATRAMSDFANPAPITPDLNRPASGDWSGMNITLERTRSEGGLTAGTPGGRRYTTSGGESTGPVRSRSPPPLNQAAAVERALTLSRKLSNSNITAHVTDKGDVMLDMHGYKLDQEETLQAETLARKILSEEIDGDYDMGALIGADRHGNLWIYSSEEAKEQAGREEGISMGIDAVSDAGYSSDDARSDYSSGNEGRQNQLATPPSTPPDSPPMRKLATSGESSRSYAKTLRLTSAQLGSLDLKPGPNEISFSVNKATCTAYMYMWKHDVPIVISDIDGTITKSDALGHVFNMIGRDWTHQGVAKLYTDVAANGYHLMYLTSRSVGQADTTRNYLNGIVQDSYKLPKGPVIMSPDRTFHALRREVYLRKPEVFKMACLRDILNLFGAKHNPFYAGFGNRLTDALSYRSVNIPSTRIFTINSNAEVSLDLLCLTKYKSSYVNMRDLVDHFFPPIERLATGEEFTDFNYWREGIVDVDDLTDSDDEQHEDEEEEGAQLGDSYLEEQEYGDEEEEEGEEGEEDEEEYEEGSDEEYDGETESEMTESLHREPPKNPSDPVAGPVLQERAKEGGLKIDMDRSRIGQAKDLATQRLGGVVTGAFSEVEKKVAVKCTPAEFAEDIDPDEVHDRLVKSETGKWHDGALD